MGHHEKLWLACRYVDDYSTQNRTPLHVSTISTVNILPNIRFTMEEEIDHVLPFLEFLIDNTHQESVVTSTFRKKTFTDLLTSSFSFTLSYKISLIRTIIDRVFKINNTWPGFHKNIMKLVFILRKNLFPVHLIDKCVYPYLNTAIEHYGST